jgi:hypothetical protein
MSGSDSFSRAISDCINLLKALSFFRPPPPADDSADRLHYDQQNGYERKRDELVFFGGFSAVGFPSVARGGIAVFECKEDYPNFVDSGKVEP